MTNELPYKKISVPSSPTENPQLDVVDDQVTNTGVEDINGELEENLSQTVPSEPTLVEQNSEGSLPRLSSVKSMVNLPQYSWLTEAALRHLIHDATPRLSSTGDEIGGNGLGSAIIRIKTKVLIDLDAFDCWVESHRSDSRSN